MKNKLYIALIITAVFALSFALKSLLAGGGDGEEAEHLTAGDCSRIISLAPSITETLYAIGLGEKIAGVTRFCNFPSAVKDKPRIGGYYDPNYELIASLNPSLVILLTEHRDARRRFQKLGIETLTVNHISVEGIIESVETIGRRCGAEESAKVLLTNILAEVEDVKRRVEKLDKKRVMVIVGRYIGGGEVKDVYISGNDGFYDDVIKLAGGINVYDGKTVMMPAVSIEGITELNPDVIIDILPDAVKEKIDESAIKAEWNGMDVKAVKEGNVHILRADYAVIPGPRFVKLLRRMAEMIHPEVGWSS
ncbi:MAG: hypothetical protein Kow0090_03490 [Myxococcota bacterium]